jgi:hypothetical protein
LPEIKILPYNSSHQEKWDKFVLKAKNSHFMFCRPYMDYHSDRFKDHSLIFMLDDTVVAVMPLNVVDNTLYSHQGLSFGGVISQNDMTTPLMVNIFDALIKYMIINSFKKLIYKAIPYIYHTNPAQEDLYVLNTKGATLSRVDVSSTINLERKIEFSSRRKRGVKTALKNELKVNKSENYEDFYTLLLERLLLVHNTKPTHSLSELKLLAERFPNNISLYTSVNKNNSICAAVLVFEMNHWAHAQYIISSEEGRKVGGVDILFNELINVIYNSKKFFDFGISTEEYGKILNTGLVTQKEEFGARAIIHNFFELSVLNKGI